jgi:ubiquitin carboxyl-terminal hydrolase 22/27/51
MKFASKRLSFKTLPPSLAIQLKRFERLDNKTSMKIDGKMKLSLSIDFSPYTTLYSSLPTFLPGNMYDLYAVIIHAGSMDTGHYTVYVKHREGWFLFDDQAVTVVKEEAVLYCDAYMVFYAQR